MGSYKKHPNNILILQLFINRYCLFPRNSCLIVFVSFFACKEPAPKEEQLFQSALKDTFTVWKKVSNAANPTKERIEGAEESEGYFIKYDTDVQRKVMLAEKSKIEKARKEFQEVIQDYSDSIWADDAAFFQLMLFMHAEIKEQYDDQELYKRIGAYLGKRQTLSVEPWTVEAFDDFMPGVLGPQGLNRWNIDNSDALRLYLYARLITGYASRREFDKASHAVEMLKQEPALAPCAEEMNQVIEYVKKSPHKFPNNH